METMEQNIMIQTENLTKRYAEKNAVESLNITIKRGEIFGFIGQNGAGKTTTIKMLTCQLMPTSGYAVVGGYNILKQEDQMKIKEMLGYCPESPFLYEQLTGAEFIDFIGKLRKIPDEERKNRMEYFFDLFNLHGFENNQIKTYSKGMRQKIALCSALFHNPSILFLDEPTQGLDPQSIRTVKNLLKEFSDNGRTIFLSTHILEVVEKLCTSIGIIHKGKLMYAGSLEALKKEMDNRDLEDIFMQYISKENTP